MKLPNLVEIYSVLTCSMILLCLFKHIFLVCIYMKIWLCLDTIHVYAHTISSMRIISAASHRKKPALRLHQRFIRDRKIKHRRIKFFFINKHNWNSTETMTANHKYLFIKIQNELIKMTIFPFISIKWNLYL